MDGLADIPVSSLSSWAGQWLAAIAVALTGMGIAFIAHWLVFRVLRRVAQASAGESDNILLNRLARPSRYAFVALGLANVARLEPNLSEVWDRLSALVMPLLVGWLAVAVLRAFVDIVNLHNRIDVVDNLYARQQRTRMAVLSRIGTFTIIFLTVAMMLFSIPSVRQVGVTLMASAGLAALAVGAAAQPALKALVAGFQLAFTQPITIDDVVIVDGEWGRIEDIRATYVVVRIWDDRRLVVPTSQFLERSFQNWTKSDARLTGTVMLYLDHAADIVPIRAEFERQIGENPLWDRRAQGTQVTDMSAETIEVRLVMTAKNSGDLWDLRCAVRESMLAWIRQEMPEALARRRNLQVAPVELRGSLGDRPDEQPIP